MVIRLVSLVALLIGGGLITAVSAQREPSPGAVHVLFDLASPSTGPFPSDWFTVQDRGNNTGLRVNLPLPDYAVRVSDCKDLDIINTLDGFNLQPRLTIHFDGNTLVFHVQHHWVTESGYTLFFDAATATTVPISQTLFAIVSYPVHLKGGTGTFAGEAGDMTAISEVDLSSGTVFRYSGKVCFASSDTQ
jgi:hypothetical protein